MGKEKVTYIKLIETVKLHDGTVVDKGTLVRLNYKEGPFLSVETEENDNIKKIFWIDEEKGKNLINRSEKINKKKNEIHEKDIKETWFDVGNVDVKSVVKKSGRPKKKK